MLSLHAVAPDAMAARSSLETACSERLDGELRIQECSVVFRKKQKVFSLGLTNTHDPLSGDSVAQSVIRRGSATVLEQETRTSAGRLVSMHTVFGRGFKGVRQIDLVSDGEMFRARVDDRTTTLFAAGTNARELKFEDGGRPPRLRIRAEVAKVIKVFSSKGKARGADRKMIAAPDRGDTTCGGCQGVCQFDYSLCTEASLLTPVCGVFTVLCFGAAAATCGVKYDSCMDACRAPGSPCCRATCAGRCIDDARDCCGDDQEFWCPAEGCCGSFCCRGSRVCRIRGSLCCERDAGDVCFFDQGCCPRGEKCLESAGGSQACCRENEVLCGFHSDGTDACCDVTQCCDGEAGAHCCGVDDVCLPNGTCCAPSQVCGQTCCPSGVCLNGDTCCPPPEFAQCGGSCCPALTTSCCNGQCCAGECLNGAICCPRERACGSTCCPAHARCIDRVSGACEACPFGQQPCPAGPGFPACCPPGTECCGNGQCCASPTALCCDFAGPVCASTCLE